MCATDSDDKTGDDSATEEDDEADEPMGAVAKYKIKKAKTPQEVVVIMAEEKKRNKKAKETKAKRLAKDKAGAIQKTKQTAKAKKIRESQVNLVKCRGQGKLFE